MSPVESSEGAGAELPATVGRALVAEDNPVNQMVVTALLRKLGYTVQMADDGAEAVRALAGGGTYDMVLMDCQMPGMDGYEATKRIRQLDLPAGQVPIIAVTASAMAADRARCLAVGMNDHMAKPIRLADLSAMLSKWKPTPPL